MIRIQRPEVPGDICGIIPAFPAVFPRQGTVRTGAQSQIRLVVPIEQIVTAGISRSGKVGDLIAAISPAFQIGHTSILHIRYGIRIRKDNPTSLYVPV